MSEYFLKPKSFGGKVIFELDLSNYATKTDLKNAKVLIHQSFMKRFVQQAEKQKLIN